MDILHGPVCDLLGCRYPIVSAGMGGVARSELVAAVTRAGGFGFLGMVMQPVSVIGAEVDALRRRGVDRFGVNIVPAATEAALLDAQVEACIDLKVPVVCLFWDLNPLVARRLRDAGIVVVCQVGSLAEARAAEEAGAQILIAQGVEAGGHVRGDRPLHDLICEVAGQTDTPVLAAGGLTSGADLATVMSLGAQGGVFGTALIPTPESHAHDYHKQRLLEAGGDDTVLTDTFHIHWPSGAKVRVLRSDVTRGERGDPFSGVRTIIGEDSGHSIPLFSVFSPLRETSGDFEAMALYAGMGVGQVTAIVGAADRVGAIAAEAMAELTSGAVTADETVQTTSPACSAHEMDDGYMGFAGREVLLPALNELLEAERAGARVTLRTAREAPDELKALVMAVHRDEARWCGVLTRAVQRLEGTPSRKIGDFHDKAMAIAEIEPRMAFLNRGQGWVARKLKELLPTIRDEAIHADLAAMLASHQVNIDLVNQRLPAVAPPRS